MIWSAAPSESRSIFPVPPNPGDQCGIWFGQMSDLDDSEMRALLFYAQQKHMRFVMHREGEITTAVVTRGA